MAFFMGAAPWTPLHAEMLIAGSGSATEMPTFVADKVTIRTAIIEIGVRPSEPLIDGTIETIVIALVVGSIGGVTVLVIISWPIASRQTEGHRAKRGETRNDAHRFPFPIWDRMRRNPPADLGRPTSEFTTREP